MVLGMEPESLLLVKSLPCCLSPRSPGFQTYLNPYRNTQPLRLTPRFSGTGWQNFVFDKTQEICFPSDKCEVMGEKFRF